MLIVLGISLLIYLFIKQVSKETKAFVSAVIVWRLLCVSGALFICGRTAVKGERAGRLQKQLY